MKAAVKPTDTKSLLLDVAEKLFSEHGISATSLRMIIAAAEVNIASIHYHFGSKEALVQEVFGRRVGPINEERLRRLDQLEAEETSEALALESIITAFIEPVIRLKSSSPRRHQTIIKLFGQLMTDSQDLRVLVSQQFEEIGSRFIAALERSLPHLSKAELVWRFRFMIGALHTILMHPPMPKGMNQFIEGPTDIKIVLKKAIPFLVGGFKAPATDLNDEEKS